MWSMSVGPLFWTFAGEMLSGHAMRMTTVVFWMSSAAVGAVGGFMVTELGIGISFFIFGVDCGLGCLFVLLVGFETKGQEKEVLRKNRFGYE